MLFRYKRIFHVGIEVFDLALVAWILLLANSVQRVDRWSDVPGVLAADGLGRLLLCIAATGAIWFTLAVRFDLYRSRRTSSLAAEIVLLGQIWVPAVSIPFALASAIWAQAPIDIGRALVFGLLAFAVERTALRGVLASLRLRGRNTRRLVVLGWGRTSESLLLELRANPHFGVLFQGLIAFDGETVPDDLPVPLLGRVSDLQRILAEVGPQIVLITPPEQASLAEVDRALETCDEAGLPCGVVPPFVTGHLRPRLDEFAGVPTIAFVPVQFGGRSAVIKRAFDLVFALVALVATLPLTVALAILIKLEDRGPVLFRQQRVGRFGHPFTCLKFRTMIVGADAMKAELLAQNEQDGPAFKMRDDPRVTRIGRFLRRFSLDELPQLWNVLVGDMSFVGPRPPTPDEVREYEWGWRRRLSVRPGLTCIWQIWGRNEVSFKRWMEMDLWYIDTWSLWKDLKLILRTILVVLRGTGR